MRQFKLICIAAFTPLCALTTLGQTPVWITNSDVNEVRIYQNGAYVLRTARSTLNSGVQEVVIDGLSADIDPQTVTVKGTGDATILSVSFQQNYLRETRKSKESVELQDKLDSLNHRLQQIQNKNQMLTETQNLLLANKSVGGANNGVMADELEPVVEYFMKKFSELKSEQLENSLLEKKVKEYIQKVQQQLNEQNILKNQPVGNIIARVDVRNKSAVTFDISYAITNNVSWIPFYDLRAKDVNGPVELQLKARVMQNTGEDWKNVKLRLNSGNPSLGSTKPDLYPWYLNIWSQPHPLYYSKDANQSMRGAGREDSAPITQMAEMKSVQVNVQQQTTSIDYEIAIPYSIPNGGKEVQVEIQKSTLKATYQYITAPKLDADAFLVANITGWEDASLMAGQASIYFDDAYVGETSINPASASDTMKISMGRDKRIIVKREKVKESDGSKLFGGNRERSFIYKLTVKNTKKEAVTVILEDQVPVSQTSEVVVTVTDDGGAEKGTEDGKLTWKLQLAPNETVTKTFSFKVKYPKDKVVGGL